LQAVKGISDLINIRGLINLDFADIRTVMASKGLAIMGTGAAKGENRAVEAATAAISSPLLENVKIDGATGIIINVTGGPDMSLHEVNEASTLITEAAHEDAEIIFGAVINQTMGDEIRVTVIATGFSQEAMRNQAHASAASTMHNFLNTSAPMQYAAPQMPQMQYAAPPQMPQMPVMPNIELPPITAVQNSVFSFTQQNPIDMNSYVAQAPMQSAPPVSVAPAPIAPQPFVPMTSIQPSTLHTSSVAPQQMPVQNPTAQMPPPPSQSSGVYAEMGYSSSAMVQTATESSPTSRDLLLAKAKAFKDSQELKSKYSPPEQLSMNIETSPQEQQSLDEARRMAREVLSSPFSSQNLEVPAFIRKKQGFDINRE
jgi:cell division protein FtsZ